MFSETCESITFLPEMCFNGGWTALLARHCYTVTLHGESVDIRISALHSPGTNSKRLVILLDLFDYLSA